MADATPEERRPDAAERSPLFDMPVVEPPPRRRWRTNDPRDADGRYPRAMVVNACAWGYVLTRPVDATFIGFHLLDGRLPDWSPDRLDMLSWQLRTSRSALAEYGDGSLGTRELLARDWVAIDAALVDGLLDIRLSELSGTHFERGNPSLAVSESAFGAVSLMTRPFASAERRGVELVKRLEAVPTFLAGAGASLAESSFVRTAWRERALSECTGAALLFSRGVRTWAAGEGLGAGLRRELEAASQRAAATIDEFAAWLRRAPVRPDESYAAGEEFLSLLIRRGHWCRQSIDDLRHEAYTALGELRAQLEERSRAAHEDGWPGVQAALAARHPPPADYLASFSRTWKACRTAARKHRLVTWPTFALRSVRVPKLRYAPIPEATREAAPYLYYLYYRSPAPLDKLPVVDYVVPPLDSLADDAARERHLRAWNDSVIKLNHVIHHGALGHHLQNAHAARARSVLGRIGATDCASRIAMFCAGTMAEGWACYATDLMDEVGFLTPLESVAEVHARVRMAARMVVDLDLHTGRMSFDEALRFYQEQVGMAAETAKAEVTKNSMFPGTAMMYRLGTEAIHALRRDVAKARGRRFSLKHFHDELLSFGSIPVLLARDIMLAGAAGGAA